MFLMASVFLAVIGDMNIKMMDLEHNVYCFQIFKLQSPFLCF